ncbi:MAG: T9SS C-terminal target domain-containing protein [Crocinitomicaceae bacterium TMED209]|nr:MAG: T9SS C-terminal target domain-containing protein [Crocinitomicaceae bacterium TMED209]
MLRFSLMAFAGLMMCLPLNGQNALEDLIQGKIDQMSHLQKMNQIRRNSFWTTSDNEVLGIPGFVMSDGPHGVRFVDATSFPTGIAMATSWNKEMMFDIGRAMGREFHAYGKHQQLGPALDLCRDPRNGRSPETGGEDPFLCAHMNIPLVRGIQTEPVVATIKHFNGVNKQENRHAVNHLMSTRQLMEHYGYNFRRVMQDAGALSVMNAYNLVNGNKSAESTELLTEILRDHWGYPFYVVSDWGSVWDAEKALKAGCDLEMDVDESEYEAHLEELYASGDITDADLDAAVRRVLRTKYMVGMMDNFPVGNPFTGANVPEHQQLAREAGREAIVMLKNEGDILPLSDEGMTVALVGPSTQVAQLDGFGSSWVDPPYAVSPYEGLVNRIGAEHVTWAYGCDINSTDTSGFQAARDVAAAADYVIFVGGLDQTQEGENYPPGPVDRTNDSVELPGVQQDLINALAEENSNVVVVLKSGGICSIPSAIDNARGFLYAFYPGMEGGNAIGDVLYGDYNPSGKLPVTMPVDDVQMPAWNDSFSDDYNCGYRYYDELDLTPQFAFGFGLSYTTYAYSNFTVNGPALPVGEPVQFSVDVTNTGDVMGEEVVQLYVENNATDVWMPKKELKGFEKVELQPGETATVNFELTANELFYYDEATAAYAVASGDYVAHVGGASDALELNVAFTLEEAAPAPDFEVTRIYHYPRFPMPTDSVLFLGLVKNAGTGDALPGTPLELTFAVNGVQVSSTSTLTDTLRAGGCILLGATEGPDGSPFWVPGSFDSFTVQATVDGEGAWDELIETNNSLEVDVDVEDPSELVPNLCYLKPVTATSTESWEYPAAKAVDGNFGTRWSSAFSDPQTITVDLLDVYTLDVIALAWETAYSSEYKLRVSLDGVNWTMLVHETEADGGNDLFYPAVDVRYIQVEGIERATEWGHSLWEIQAFGELSMSQPELDASFEIKVVPNPSSGVLNILGVDPNETVTVSVSDLSGRLVATQRIQGGQTFELPNSVYSAGYHVVRVQAREGDVTRLIYFER